MEGLIEARSRWFSGSFKDDDRLKPIEYILRKITLDTHGTNIKYDDKTIWDITKNFLSTEEGIQMEKARDFHSIYKKVISLYQH